MNHKLIAFLLTTFVCTSCLVSNAQTNKAEKSTAERVRNVTNKINRKQKYQLAYKLRKGEEIISVVEHTADTKTQMAGETVKSSSRAETTRNWSVANVDSLGNMTFVYSIVGVNMWTKFDDEKPDTYDSVKDTEVPDQYKATADSIGKPLVVFTISPNGEILDKKSNLPTGDFSVGDVTVPLPKEPIAVGHVWNVPTILNANEGKKQVKLKAQIRYHLRKVERKASGDIAYIDFKTQVISEMSEKVKSTVMQKMTRGIIGFNIKLGRPMYKVVEWNETVQGFEGPDSYLRLVGRITEKIKLDSDTSSSKLTPVDSAVASKPASIKTREGGPILRK